MRTTKWFAMLLAGCLLLSHLMACHNGSDTETDAVTQTDTEAITERDTADESATETDKETETETETETTPSIKYDRTLKVVTLTEKMSDIVPDSEKRGEALTEAILARNVAFDQEFGVSIQVIDGGDYESLKNMIRREQSQREDAYDIYINQLYAFTGNALQNHLVDLNEMPGVNLQNPWWDQACRENLTIDGRNFMMSGDISPDSLLYSACMVFNKRMMEDLKKEDPYGLVENGEWTLDALYHYIDGVTNESLGRYGLTSWSFDVPFSLFYGCGETFVKFNEDGRPEVSYDSSKVKGIYESMYNIIYGAKSNYVQLDFNHLSPSPDWGAYEPFVNGNALFADVTLHKIATYLSGMKDDYGILPMPKYEAGQGSYLSFVNGAAGHVMVSNTERDREFVGTMLEALGMYNYIAVTPFFAVVVAQDVQNPDPVNAEMVNDIIRNRVYDFAYWTKEKLVISDLIFNELTKKNQNINSSLSSAKSKSVSSLQKIIYDWEKILSCN